MANENRSWGYDRIVGALANLGYYVSDQTAPEVRAVCIKVHVRIGDPGKVNPVALEMDKEEHAVGHQISQ
jgi:hypothetical protein